MTRAEIDTLTPGDPVEVRGNGFGTLYWMSATYLARAGPRHVRVRYADGGNGGRPVAVTCNRIRRQRAA